MDFTWLVAHPFVLNPGAPTGFTDTTLGKKGPFCAFPKHPPATLMQRVGKLL